MVASLGNGTISPGWKQARAGMGWDGTASCAEAGGEGVGRENLVYTFYMESGPLIRTDTLHTLTLQREVVSE